MTKANNSKPRKNPRKRAEGDTRFTFQLSKEDLKAFKTAAAADGRTLSSWMRVTLARGVKQTGESTEQA